MFYLDEVLAILIASPNLRTDETRFALDPRLIRGRRPSSEKLAFECQHLTIAFDYRPEDAGAVGKKIAVMVPHGIHGDDDGAVPVRWYSRDLTRNEAGEIDISWESGYGSCSSQDSILLVAELDELDSSCGTGRPEIRGVDPCW
ncbi:MAG: hypothetical protein ACREDF_06785 [Thermoplasmata archaeon]